MRIFGLFVVALSILIELADAQSIRRFEFDDNITEADYEPATIIVKIRQNQNRLGTGEGSRPEITPSLLSDRSNVLTVEPIQSTFRESARTRVITSPHLRGIYRLTLKEGTNLEREINQLLKFDNIIYAEPVYREQLLFVPNDPQANPGSGNQSYLGVVKAYEAWDIQKGGTDISVAVIDTGGDLDHVDLTGNLLTNDSDPINGVDDDSDGLIDNFNGYDFADSDNDPTADNSGHGVLVNGLSSATSDNSEGIAGTGFNSKYVPYKVFKSADNQSNNTFEAVLFAAEKGHQVMNLSWGSINSFSQFNQDIINTAVLVHDAVIIAAAGNTPDELDFYPASYDNVISVASTNTDDTKSSFSTFSYNIDIAAPGTNNYTTTNGGGYGFSGPGTSFSSPLVAGAAALLRAEFPHWTAQQIMEQLRVTAEDIYSVGNNNDFFGQLGKGRLDMFTALNDTTLKSVRLTTFDYDARHGKQIFYGDTVELTTSFKNFLQPTTTASVTISSDSEFTTIVNPQIDLGALFTLEDFDQTIPVRIFLSDDTPADETIRIRLDFTDIAYTDWQFKKFNTSPDYLDMGTSSLTLTVAGNANLGYEQDVYTNGSGLIYNGTLLANNLGMVLLADGTVVDNATSDFAGQIREQDFATSKNVKLFANSTADNFGLSFSDDSNAGANETGFLVEQKTLSWNDSGNEDYLILEYRISNTSGANISDLKIALFNDWDINNLLENTVDWDGTNNLGYGTGGTVLGGTALLTSHTPIFYAIDKGSENGNTPELGTTFSKPEKSTFMSSGVAKTQAGLMGGNDVAQMTGGELGPLNSGESVKIAFAVVGGNSLSELQDAVQKAAVKYQEFLDLPPLIRIDTTCLGESARITLTSGTSFEFYSDAQGTDLLHSGNNYETPILNDLTQFYVQNVDSIYKTDLRTVRLIPQDIIPVVDFEDTLFLGDVPNNIVQFKDETSNATQWLWNFDNGSGSTNQSPISQFNQTGDYQISLTVTNKYGCTAQTSTMLRVRERGPAPEFNTFQVCKGEPVSVNSVANNNLRVYANLSDKNAVFEGKPFVSGSLEKDTTFFISSTDAEFESTKIAVPVVVIDLKPEMSFQPDSLDLSNKNLIQFFGSGQNISSIGWEINEATFTVTNPIFDFTGVDEISATMEISDENGCVQSISSTIVPQTGAPPDLSDAVICTGDNLVINPGNGFYYFYSDKSLNNLIHKGKSFTTEAIERDTTFYVTNAEDLIESEADSIQVSFFPFEADFTMTPNPLILEEDFLVRLVDATDGAISWKWYLDGELIEIARNPILFFREEGDYEIKLAAQNDKGCISEMVKDLRVRLVSGISANPLGVLNIYPNPARKQVNIRLSSSTVLPLKWELVNLTGKQIRTDIMTSPTQSLDLEGISPGIYLLRLIGRAGFYDQKIILE